MSSPVSRDGRKAMRGPILSCARLIHDSYKSPALSTLLELKLYILIHSTTDHLDRRRAIRQIQVHRDGKVFDCHDLLRRRLKRAGREQGVKVKTDNDTDTETAMLIGIVCDAKSAGLLISLGREAGSSRVEDPRREYGINPRNSAQATEDTA